MDLEKELLREPSKVFVPYAYLPIYRPGRIREPQGKEIDKLVMTCVIGMDYFHLLHTQKGEGAMAEEKWSQWASHYLILLRKDTYLRRIWEYIKVDYNEKFASEIGIVKTC